MNFFIQQSLLRKTTAHNTANNDTRSFDIAMLKLSSITSCARSIAFAAGQNELLVNGKSKGVVCRNVI